MLKVTRLARREPWSELENLFDNQPAQTGSFGWDLAVDVCEERDKVAAKMQLRGVDPEKVDVSFEDGQHLRVVGTREEKHEIKKFLEQGNSARIVGESRSVARASGSGMAEPDLADGVFKNINGNCDR